MGRTREEDEARDAGSAKERSLPAVMGGAPIVLALSLVACPGEVAPPPATPTQAPPAAVVAPRAQVAGYVLADPHALPPTVAVPLDNGSFGVVLDGARFVTGAGGDARKAASIAEPRITRVERVPARLGGGFLFMGALALYRSEAFDGPLTPLIALPEQATQVSFGPKGALVRGVSGQRWAFAMPSWARVPISPVGLVDMVGHGDGRALATTELGRALASTNAGERWDDVTSKLAGAPARVSQIGEDLWLFEDGGRPHRLERGGSFREVERAPAEPARQAKDPRWRGAASPLKTAVLLGAPARAPGVEPAGGLAPSAGAAADEATAIVASSGDIARVDLRTGALLSVAPGRLPPSMTCSAMRTPDDVVFVCADGRASLVASGGLRGEPVIEQTFEADGIFYASDDGGLVFGGPCPPEKEGPRKACARDIEGGWTEHSLDAAIERAGPKGPPPAAQLVRWVARGSAPPLAIVATESLATVDLATGRAVSWSGASIDELFPGSRPQAAGKPPASMPKDARPRLDRRWSATTAGSLDGWLSPGRAVSVSAAGDVRLSPFTLDAGSMSGARALGATRDGRVFQTLNHGLTWAEVERPPSASTGPIRSCSDVGCDLGSWLRIGWSEAPPSPAPPPEVASAPPMLARPALPEMVCAPLGEVRTVSAPLRETEEPGLGATLIPSSSGPPRDGRTFSYTQETFSYRLIHPAREDTSGSNDTAPRLTVHGFEIARVDDGSAGPPFEVLGPSRAPGSFQRTFTFIAPLDPAAPMRSVSLGLSALTPLFRASNAAPIELLASFAQTSFELLPVLPAEPGGAVDLAFTMPAGEGQIIGLLSAGTAPRMKLLVLRAKSGSPVSAAALPGGDLALLSIEADGRERLLRVSKTGVVELAEIPGVEQHRRFAANPDALAIGPGGALAVLRTPSGDEPASIGDPALLLKLPQIVSNTTSTGPNSIVMEALAPWSTLTAANQPACSGEQAGYRAILHTQAPWVRVRGSQALESSVTAMTAVVQWGSSRACLEAIELPDTPHEPGTGSMTEMMVAARFGRTPDAGRFGVRLGSESRQPLTCALASGAPSQPADPLNMR